MSQLIDVARSQQYGKIVYHLSQQKGSRLRGAVRLETMRGKAKFLDRLGAVTAVKNTTRHGDTPQFDTPHSRRMLTLTPYHYADLIDDEDRIRMEIDPTNDYVMAAVWALGRAMDDEIINALAGNAFAGESGTTVVALPNARKLAAADGTNGTKLNVQALRRAKKMLDEQDVDPSIRRFIAPSASQMENLLSATEVTSSDFNTVKALVQGELDTFLGFKFIRHQRNLVQDGTLNFSETTGAVGTGSKDADGYEKVPFWAEDGVILGLGRDIRARISERDDKNYSTQVYASMDIGATRMEEAKVGQILCVA